MFMNYLLMGSNCNSINDIEIEDFVSVDHCLSAPL